ncbi:transcriptional activator protein acu-15 [Botrytis cinerea]
MHDNRRPSLSSTATSPPVESRKESSPPREDMFKVQASPHLLEGDHSNPYFMGASSGRSFVDICKRKIQDSIKSSVGFDVEAFLNPQNESTSLSSITPAPSVAPPRLFSDQCVNVFFQEWAPLFPVIHKHTFLPLYDEYSSNPNQVKDQHKLAQLHLVFGIAGLSTDCPDKEQISLCESQWRTALNNVLMENNISTLQCLILALIYCIQKGDYNSLQHYKGIAVGLSHRLGLHQSQKRFSFDLLAAETRKRVFWTLYTVDCFSASLIGLPKLLREDDIYAEYPSDIDDEHMNEKGFQSMPPGEPTRISSALALFRCSRILSKVLEQIYPSATTHDLSLQTLFALAAELNEWSDNLPSHLKLTFVQDKPSTDITGSRSALLSLAFYYIRSLIHRPAIGLDIKQEGKLMQESQRLIKTVIRFLEKANAPGAADFKKLASSLITLDSQSLDYRTKSALLRTSSSMSAPKSSKSTASASMSENDILAQQEKLRRSTLPNIYHHASQIQASARSSYDETNSDSPITKRQNRSSLSQLSKPRYNTNAKAPNLDYLSLSNTPITSQQPSPTISRTAPPGPSSHNSHLMYSKIDNQQSEWAILASLESGESNIHSAIYGGPPPSLSETTQSAPSNSSYEDWTSSTFWHDMTANTHDPLTNPAPAQSVLSFSGRVIAPVTNCPLVILE